MAAKVTRAIQKLFGSTGPTNQFGKFGSLAAAAPATSKDPAQIQSLSNYLQGWFGAVVGNNSPAIEDMNSLCYLFSYQLAYLLQQGIPEYDVAQEYFIGSYVTYNSKLYYSIQDNNINHLPTDASWWLEPPPLLSTETVTGDTTMIPNKSYKVNKSGSLCVMTLPATATVGDRIEITGLSSNGWAIYNNTAQTQTIFDSSVFRTQPSGDSAPLYAGSGPYSAVDLVYVGSQGWTVFSKNGGATVQNYFGTGADGDVTISTNTNLTPPGITGSYDAEMVVKNYRNLTVNAACTLTTSQPCRGLLIYCTGNLVVNGTITMTNKGSFTNATTVGVGAGGIDIQRYKTGQSAATPSTNRMAGCGTLAIDAENQQPVIPGPLLTVNVPRAGGAGGVYGPSNNPGGTATNAMGGGGTGGGFTASGGNGTAGTCFAGGTGGGGAGVSGDGGLNGTANGGAGGAGGGSGGGSGAGNPAPIGGASLGGLLIIIVKGTVTVASGGVISANGGAGGTFAYAGGGGGGGGRVIILSGGAYSNSGTVSANGGAGGAGAGGGNTASPGGNGVVTQNTIDA